MSAERPRNPATDSTTDVLVGALAEPPPAPARRVGALLIGAGATLLVGVGVVSGLAWSLDDGRTLPGLTVAGIDVGGLDRQALSKRLAEVADRELVRPLTVDVSGKKLERSRRDAGWTLETDVIADRAFALGHSGDAPADLVAWAQARRHQLQITPSFAIDRTRLLDFVADLKSELDRPAIDAHLDLDHHTIAPEQNGIAVDLYASAARIESVARSGGSEVALVLQGTDAQVKADALASLDISTVLGKWETRYSSTGADSDRTYNLKVGAAKLNGHVLAPHEIFSFNQVVGDRTEKEGYRVAPVIAGGELIDGLAGGMCQIASTLHAASFFGGLEIVEARPHSRPSVYIPMGLDSTVVYPDVDLKLRNPYDFPVVMHYTVNQGSVKVELLGKARPYDVVFEREIKSETPFRSESRRDPEARAGQKLLLQDGYPGYSLLRRRYLFEKGQAPKVKIGETVADAMKRQKIAPAKKAEQVALGYPSTAMIVAYGSGSAKLKPKPAPPSHRIPPIPATDKPLFRILQ